jgi:hypothetical protein
VLLNLARSDSVDLSLSRVFVRDGVAVGAALIARRGWTCRLAGMGIVKEARRTGIGRAAVLQLLAEANARGDRAMVLEVIEQNTAAVELYRALGFETIRRLIGFSGVVSAPGGSAAPPGDGIDLIEIDLREVGAAITRFGLPDLPWQLSGETIAQLVPPAIGYRLDNTWIALTDPTQPIVTVRALIADPFSNGDGTPSCRELEAALLRAVIAKHPGKTEWRFSPIWPEELATAIEPVGLLQSSLAQWQMHHVLARHSFGR